LEDEVSRLDDVDPDVGNVVAQRAIAASGDVSIVFQLDREVLSKAAVI